MLPKLGALQESTVASSKDSHGFNTDETRIESIRENPRSSAASPCSQVLSYRWLPPQWGGAQQVEIAFRIVPSGTPKHDVPLHNMHNARRGFLFTSPSCNATFARFIRKTKNRCICITGLIPALTRRSDVRRTTAQAIIIDECSYPV
jgi:hypothetical protein